MKIKPEHYDVLRLAIERNKENIEPHRRYLLSPENPRPCKDVEKRLRWDLIYAAKLAPWIRAEISPYANDDHIDAALRKIMAEVEITPVGADPAELQEFIKLSYGKNGHVVFGKKPLSALIL